jgi:hypothetical protein
MHSDVPLEDQRERWPVSYALSIQCRISGPRHSAAITDLDSFIDLAGRKARRGGATGLLWVNRGPPTQRQAPCLAAYAAARFGVISNGNPG